MIDNRVLQQNIRIIQNVLCQKNKLQNSGVETIDVITLIRSKQFPLIPSFLKFLNDMEQLQSVISFVAVVQKLINLIKYQMSNSQIATSNTFGFHGPQGPFGDMCAHVIGTPIVFGSTDLSSITDNNGIRWVNPSELIDPGLGMLYLFGKELADKYVDEVSVFLNKYNKQSDKIIMRDFFNIFYKNFLYKNQKQLKDRYLKRARGPALDSDYGYKQFVMSNYRIKHVIFPPQRYDFYGGKLPADIDEEFKTKAQFLLKKNNISFSTQDIDDYMEKHIPEKYQF